MTTNAGYCGSPSNREKATAAGRTYNYFDVPPQAVAELVSAESHGRYVNRWIKPFYECEAVR